MKGKVFEKPALEVMQKRKSIRNYTGEKLDRALCEQLKQKASTIEAPFDLRVRFVFVNEKDMLKAFGDTRLGTYGVIRGATTYVGAVVQRGPYDLEQTGYAFEKWILYATDLNLGTCWLGGTYKKQQFQSMVRVKDDEWVPAISPVGIPKKKPHVADAIMRAAVRSDRRQPGAELFFDNDFGTPLTIKQEPYRQALEAVRCAPSSSNKQPWRIVKKGENYRFYRVDALGYAKALGFNIQRIDIGIAMCHFELALCEQGVTGRWRKEEAVPQSENNKAVYTVTWVPDA